ncbi:hypothetical protein KQH60_12215 [Mycetohabitans sp. B8]|nr:hypothetical protein [Mycetohabitans sp. B8]MCG1043260.1 hypothetical protein [Mycetohabitans sp. B8]
MLKGEILAEKGTGPVAFARTVVTVDAGETKFALARIHSMRASSVPQPTT